MGCIDAGVEVVCIAGCFWDPAEAIASFTKFTNMRLRADHDLNTTPNSHLRHGMATISSFEQIVPSCPRKESGKPVVLLTPEEVSVGDGASEKVITTNHKSEGFELLTSDLVVLSYGSMILD